MPFRNVLVEAGEFSALVDDKWTAVVRKGRILVRDPAAPKKAGLWVGANRKVTVSPRTSLVEPISAAAADREFTWTDGRLHLKAGTLSEAAKTMNRFNDVVIEPAPDVAGLFVGAQDIGLNKPEKLVKRIVDAHGLVSQKQGDTIVIFREKKPPTRR